MKIVSTLTCALTALVLSGSAGAGAASTPFKGVFTYSSALAANPSPCPMVRVDSAGRGQATYLGRFSISQSHCLNPQSPLAFTGGTLVATAANGDLLYGTYGGAFVPTGAPGVFTVVGSFTITGGTGRFARATGSGSASGEATFAGGTIALDGSIAVDR